MTVSLLLPLLLLPPLFPLFLLLHDPLTLEAYDGDEQELDEFGLPVYNPTTPTGTLPSHQLHNCPGQRRGGGGGGGGGGAGAEGDEESEILTPRVQTPPHDPYYIVLTPPLIPRSGGPPPAPTLLLLLLLPLGQLHCRVPGPGADVLVEEEEQGDVLGEGQEGDHLPLSSSCSSSSSSPLASCILLS